MSPCCRGSAASPRVWARAQHTKRDGFAFDRRRYRSSVARNSVPWPRRSRCITLATQGSGLLGTSPFPLTLERCVGDSLGEDDALWATGAFAACTYPDLPAALTWRGLLNQAMGSSRVGQDPVPAHLRPGTLVPPGSGPLVRTVACQMKSERELRSALVQAAGGSGGVQRAGALLVLGGGHPVRVVSPWVARRVFLPAERALRVASEMRAAGDLPPDLELWAVANPLKDDPAWAEVKAEAGAVVLLTQPPLAWGPFEAWAAGIMKRGLHRDVRILGGLPIVSSAGNMRFWTMLCGAVGRPEAEEHVKEFEKRKVTRDGGSACVVPILGPDGTTRWVRVRIRVMASALPTHASIPAVGRTCIAVPIPPAVGAGHAGAAACDGGHTRGARVCDHPGSAGGAGGDGAGRVPGGGGAGLNLTSNTSSDCDRGCGIERVT